MNLDERPDFVSILDADFVPTPVLLSRALRLFHAEDVGIVRRRTISSIPIRSSPIFRHRMPGPTSSDTSSTC